MRLFGALHKTKVLLTKGLNKSILVSVPKNTQLPVIEQCLPPLIAIVDDDASVRSSLCRLVRAFGFNAESFDSAESYLNSAHCPSPKCLVLDVHMPGLSGFELHRKMLEMGDKTPIIFITANANAYAQDQVHDLDVIDFLSKPFEEEEFRQSLERAIQG